MTVAAALRLGAARLAAAGVPDPAWDAERLLRHVLGWDRAALLAARPDTPLSSDSAATFQRLLDERARRRPLQHLLGVQEFWGRQFRVTPDVLIPRPETELIVETALTLLRGVEAPCVADVGTGSGCIALTLAAERPDAVVHAMDVSAAALAVAEDNARGLGLAGRVSFLHGDLLAPVAGLRFDLVASNPPYVDAAELASLEPEVRDHEPRAALVPGPDPYAAYRRLVPQAANVLRAGGFLLLEIGHGMQAAITGLCEQAGLRVLRVVPDLHSIPRTVVATSQ